MLLKLPIHVILQCTTIVLLIIHIVFGSKPSPNVIQHVRVPSECRNWSTIARSVQPTTDKISLHGYDTIYDYYFTGDNCKRSIKVLEIGLGCGMQYGPGASSKIWPALLPHADVWFAEYDKRCIDGYVASNNVSWRYVTGDQGDISTLHRWLAETGGNFMYIIDDGGHTNNQIWNTFNLFFDKGLVPGGVYFIEDIHVGRHPIWYDGGITGLNGSAVIDVLAEWIDQLVVRTERASPKAVTREYRHALPAAVERVDCVQDMCAITKRKRK